jgi:hypothetical protein
MIRDSQAAELSTDEALRAFVDDFENCRIPLSEWSHAAHVAMAMSYLQTLPEQEVLPKVRTQLQHYVEFMGVPKAPDRGYHETLTVFWLAICEAFLRDCPLSGAAAARAAVEAFGKSSKLHEEYYGFDVVRSPEARAGWVPPDRKPLP